MVYAKKASHNNSITVIKGNDHVYPPHKYAVYAVPEVQSFDPVSANGVIMVQWNFIHTGGLDLTGLAAEYSYVDGTSTVIQPITISGLDTTSVNESGLITGFVYTFSITAENSNGLSTVSCRPTPHIIGECSINSEDIYAV